MASSTLSLGVLGAAFPEIANKRQTSLLKVQQEQILTRLDERVTKGDDLAMLERDVGDSVGEGHTVQPLLNVRVADLGSLRSRLDRNFLRLDTELGLGERDGRVLDSSIRTLAERMVDTFTESLQAGGC